MADRAEGINALIAAERERCAACVPTTWLDELLTGPNAVIGTSPYDCRDIERLLQAIADRIRGSSATDGVQRVEVPSYAERVGRVVVAQAQALGWKQGDDEDAFMFMMRRCREVAIEDADGVPGAGKTVDGGM